jgi:hypothetical protein
MPAQFAPLPSGVAGSKPPALNLAYGQVVEPDFLSVAGSTDRQGGIGQLSVYFF